MARWKRGGKKARNDFLVERLFIMRNVALALKYLHSLDVLYRDLKPENLGFDLEGRILLFDFGLAVELRSEDRLHNGTYNIPQGGTLRYMPPEVARKKPCNCSADVYSFGILFWAVLSLETPFAGFTTEKFSSLVLMQGYRPKISSSWPSEVKSLITKCWSDNFKERPKCKEICDTLNGLLRNMSGLEDKVLDNVISSSYHDVWTSEDRHDFPGIRSSRLPQWYIW